MKSPEQKAKEIFGERAAFYTTSASHTDAQVLARVVELSAPHSDWNVLDIATGTGHTAFALSPHVASVTGIDLTPEMLREAETLKARQSFGNVVFKIADVHDLPFPDASFDLITCRRAAHHFSNIRRALLEIRRVLVPGGRVVIDDRSVPEDDFVDQCMNRLDTFHDESHVREYRPSEWGQMFAAAGLRLEAIETYIRHRPLSALTQGVSEQNVKAIQETLATLTPAQREAFHLVEKDGEMHLNHWFVLTAAIRE